MQLFAILHNDNETRKRFLEKSHIKNNPSKINNIGANNANTLTMGSSIINREISWLSFNERVLQEAADSNVPLIERLRFLGIFSNNLDEFYRVRVATLKRLKQLYIKEFHPGVEEVGQLLETINEIDINQQSRFLSIYQEIQDLLEKEGIFFLDESKLDQEQGEYVRNYFHQYVRSNIFPIMIKNLKRSTNLKDKSIYLAVQMRKTDGSIKDNYSIIKVPTTSLTRFLILPSQGHSRFIMLLDDVIRYCLPDIFSIFEYDDFKAYTIKVTRDAELDIDNDVSKSFMERVSESLKQRKEGRPVRFIYDNELPSKLLKLLTTKLKISDKDSIIKGGRYHNFKDFMDFPSLDTPHLCYEPRPALLHKDLIGARSILSAIRQKDIMVHFPYQSFQYVIDLLREASIDPRVKSIKMTVYRLAKNSKVINALINAARNGKEVTVFMELQARFDEQANIFWSQKLQEEGVKIIHGLPGMKVHCKLILIKRRENHRNILYANVGTGNFNEESAKVYSDESLLTVNPEITSEVEQVFELFEKTYYAPVSFETLVVSPFKTRSFLTRMINKEIANARKGLKAEIFLKVNNVVDDDLVKKLYTASQNGVKIRIIARGICVLIPGLPQISENIEVISVIDRYLEHSRVFVFYNGGEEKYYISSADIMARNLDHRIEVVCPILDPIIKQELRDILEIQWSDNVKARMINIQQTNEYRKDVNEPFRSQDQIYKYFKALLPHKN